eukprot:TRINITY_DN1107_c0_g2_i2.p3 TRINITY_DN1107_c0_g2~~TRINITY_DN1107_c0_g2_i2.p3  ORF type:complete len:191 (+),score=45.20 TRINITY_DN1107_c0_g2_i2:514-1086(+)
MKGLGVDLSEFFFGVPYVNAAVGCTVGAALVMAEVHLGVVQAYLDACFEVQVTRLAPGTAANFHGPVRAAAVHGPRNTPLLSLAGSDLEQGEVVFLRVSASHSTWSSLALPTAQFRVLATSGDAGQRWAKVLNHPEGSVGLYALHPQQHRFEVLYVGTALPATEALVNEFLFESHLNQRELVCHWPPVPL